MQRIIEMSHMFVGAVDGQCVHGQVVGSDGEEIAMLRQRIRRQGGARHLDHGAEGGQRIGHGHFSAAQTLCRFLQNVPGPLDLRHAADHGQQNTQITVPRRP